MATEKQLLTDEFARNCQPELKDFAIADTLQRGLFLRVQPSGAKSWVARRTIDGSYRRQFLGKVSKMTVEEARQAFRAGRIRRRQRKKGSRLKFETFLGRYLRKMRTVWKPSTYRTTETRLKAKCLPTFSGRVLVDITHADIAAWFHHYSRTYPGGANEALTYVKAMFNAALRWGDLPDHHKNPATGLRRNRRKMIAQLLNQAEVIRLLEAIENLAGHWPHEAAAIRMLLFTGCRRGEVLNLTWDQVRDDRLQLADSKTGPRTVLLNSEALEVLREQRRHREPETTLVFPRRRSGRPFENLDIPWKRVKVLANLPPSFRLHDLRHTFASHSVMAGTTLFVTGRLLGHKRLETTARYAHLLDDHLQEAAEQISSDIWRTMQPPPAPEPEAKVPKVPSSPRNDRLAREPYIHAASNERLKELLAIQKEMYASWRRESPPQDPAAVASESQPFEFDRRLLGVR